MPCIINYLMNTTDDLFFSDCFEALISTMTSIKSWISSLPHCWIQFQFNPANIEEVWSLDCIMRLRCAEGQQGRDLDKETQCHRHHLLLMSENLMIMWPVWEVWSNLCGHYRANTWHTELCNHLRVFTLTLHQRHLQSQHSHASGARLWCRQLVHETDLVIRQKCYILSVSEIVRVKLRKIERCQ